jgi:hypothetical protein
MEAVKRFEEISVKVVDVAGDIPAVGRFKVNFKIGCSEGAFHFRASSEEDFLLKRTFKGVALFHPRNLKDFSKSSLLGLFCFIFVAPLKMI